VVLLARPGQVRVTRTGGDHQSISPKPVQSGNTRSTDR